MPRVWLNDSQTNMCREYTAVKISACTFRRRPVTGSVSMPIYPKSSWHSPPGSPSATRTVAALRPYPHRSAQNRCNVRYGTVTPCRSSSTPILTTVSSSSTHALTCA